MSAVSGGRLEGTPALFSSVSFWAAQGTEVQRLAVLLGPDGSGMEKAQVKRKERRGVGGRECFPFCLKVSISAFHNSAESRKHSVMTCPKRKESTFLPN